MASNEHTQENGPNHGQGTVNTAGTHGNFQISGEPGDSAPGSENANGIFHSEVCSHAYTVFDAIARKNGILFAEASR